MKGLKQQETRISPPHKAVTSSVTGTADTPPPSRANLKGSLDGILLHMDKSEDRDHDPVGLVHQMPAEDQEAGAFIAAMFAFGRTTSIRNTVQKLFVALTGNITGQGLKQYLLANGSNRDKIRAATSQMQHRWIGPEDFSTFLFGLTSMLSEHHTIEAAFNAHRPVGHAAPGPRQSEPAPLPAATTDAMNHWTPATMAAAITSFSGDLLLRTGLPATRGLKWLLPSPVAGSAAKRFCLFLRWMCRPADGIDLGLWSSISPRSLVIPLDVHIHRISKRLGLTSRNDGSWRTAVEITEALAAMDAEDPLKYDFAICHLGVRGDCPSQPGEECSHCPARGSCLLHQTHSTSTSACASPGSQTTPQQPK